MKTNNINKKKKLKISPRELACLRLLAEGYSPGQIAKQLNIERDTVWSFLKRIREKFETDVFHEIISKARKERII